MEDEGLDPVFEEMLGGDEAASADDGADGDEEDELYGPEPVEAPAAKKPAEKAKSLEEAKAEAKRALERAVERDEEKAERKRLLDIAEAAVKSKGEPKAKEEPKPKRPRIADDTPEKFADDIAARGHQALRDRGFVSIEDVHEMVETRAREIATEVSSTLVNQAAAQMGADSRTMAEFPELADQKSVLFKKTQEIFQEMLDEDPNLKTSSAALKFAARLAKAQIAPAEKERAGKEREEERRGRIAAQSSGSGKVKAAEDGSYISPLQAQFLKGMGVSGDAFKREVKAMRRAR